MTPTLKSKIEEMAEEYAVFQGKAETFKAGAAAMYELMMEREAVLVDALKWYAAFPDEGRIFDHVGLLARTTLKITLGNP